MKTTHLVIALATLFLVTIASPTNAQSLMERMAKKAAEKLEQKTEDRIDRKIDKGIDKGLDGVEESVKSDNKESQTSSNTSNSEEDAQKKVAEMMRKMGMSSDPVIYADSYLFNSSMKMNIKTVNKKGKVLSDGDMVSYLSQNNKQMAYEFVSGDIDVKNAPKNKGIIILDFDNKSTLILSNENKEKTGIAYGLPDLFNEDVETATDDYEDVSSQYKKTGRTKSILGYKCDEYEYSDENTKGTFWITNDYKSARSSGLPALFNRSGVPFGNANGFLMASESTNLKSGEKSSMEVTEINSKKDIRFDTKQYQITNMGSLGMPKNE